ncbi:cora-like Mg2+ transporter protein-domain-containing protein [Tribonema minus]|uniref:Cora-like Mg2+ transporter protein-domain-containing protein n=1 Tax=Tribonema minus TaxID=303371 RepID=A0A835YKG6_9STRA|nr:cora-like Mg2+ transporter protein-domain-containing protein [Tribonema minus]
MGGEGRRSASEPRKSVSSGALSSMLGHLLKRRGYSIIEDDRYFTEVIRLPSYNSGEDMEERGGLLAAQGGAQASAGADDTAGALPRGRLMRTSSDGSVTGRQGSPRPYQRVGSTVRNNCAGMTDGSMAERQGSPRRQWGGGQLRLKPSSFASSIAEHPNTSGGADAGAGGSGGGGDDEDPGANVEFDPDYDTSPEHLEKLFDLLDKNKNGSLSVDEVRMGLAGMRPALYPCRWPPGAHVHGGAYTCCAALSITVSSPPLPPPPSLPLLPLQSFLKGDKSQGLITRQVFVDTVRENAARMYRSNKDVNPEMFVCDYSPHSLTQCRIETNRAAVLSPRRASAAPAAPPPSLPPSARSSFRSGDSPVISLEEFLREPRLPGASKVRWIGITGMEPSLVIRLAHKYDIHPLQVEDALSPSTERLKVDRSVEGVVHVLLCKVMLHEPSQGWPSNIQKEQISIFLIDDTTVVYIEKRPTGVTDTIAGRIMYAGSKIRLNNARFLVYTIVDAIVDEVRAPNRWRRVLHRSIRVPPVSRNCCSSAHNRATSFDVGRRSRGARLRAMSILQRGTRRASKELMFPIVQHFHRWLVQLQGKVQSEKETPLAVVKAIQQINRDMNMLQFYLRPMKAAVAQLVAELPDADDKNLRRHLEDLLDHVVVLEEQAYRMTAWSRSLNDDFMNEQTHRMNNVMYLLTMVTTAFLPGQFLTGVFGMNFKYMPELDWKYSYLIFWALIFALATFVFNFYRKNRWL